MQLNHGNYFSPRAEGHEYLGFSSYLHWTSPLRRFEDFVNHSNLAAHFDGRPYPYQGEQLEETARHLTRIAVIRHREARQKLKAYKQLEKEAQPQAESDPQNHDSE